MNYFKTISAALVMVAMLLGVLPPCTAKRRNGSRKSSSDKDCQVKQALDEMRSEIMSLASEVKYLKQQISDSCGVGVQEGHQVDEPDSIHHVGVDDTSLECRPDEFQCNDGSCIDKESVCDDVLNCPDAGDEAFCPLEDETTTTIPHDVDYGEINYLDHWNVDHDVHHGMDHAETDQVGQAHPIDTSPDVLNTTEIPIMTGPTTTTTTDPTTTTTDPTTTTTTTTTTTSTTSTPSTTTTTTLPPPEGPPPEVPECAAPYLQVGHTCFYPFTYFEDWRSWGEANAKCQTIGGTLAAPWNFLDLQQFLLHRYTITFWVGVHFNVKSRTWKWLSGKKMAKEFWKPGQPSRGAKRCAYLDYHSNYKAVSHYCGEKFPFICEMNTGYKSKA